MLEKKQKKKNNFFIIKCIFKYSIKKLEYKISLGKFFIKQLNAYYKNFQLSQQKMVIDIDNIIKLNIENNYLDI